MTSAYDPRACCGLAGRLDAATLAALDEALRASVPYRKARERAGLGPESDSAVYKHRSHLLEAGKEADPKRAGAEGKQGEAKSVLESSRTIRRRVSKLLRRIENGEDGIDFKAAASLAGQFKGMLELEAKLLGEIKAASTTVNVYQSADWEEFRELLVEALATDHPAALDAVVALIAEREAHTVH